MAFGSHGLSHVKKQTSINFSDLSYGYIHLNVESNYLTLSLTFQANILTTKSQTGKTLRLKSTIESVTQSDALH